MLPVGTRPQVVRVGIGREALGGGFGIGRILDYGIAVIDPHNEDRPAGDDPALNYLLGRVDGRAEHWIGSSHRELPYSVTCQPVQTAIASDLPSMGVDSRMEGAFLPPWPRDLSERDSAWSR